jgi:tungstate transport system permease protein
MSSSVLSEAIVQAGKIILQGQAELWEIIFLSFRVSLIALFFSVIIGLIIASLMTVYQFPGKKILHIVVDSLMALPPVVVGLFVYLLLSQSGPLGIWGLLYTPSAMIIAQTILITPLVIALSMQVYENHWLRLREQLHMLGYQPRHCFSILTHEARAGLLTVMLAAFGRAIAEIGAVMVVGGNIEHYTRVMTTAIAMETRQGNLALALALGLVLIILALILNIGAHFLNRKIRTS